MLPIRSLTRCLLLAGLFGGGAIGALSAGPALKIPNAGQPQLAVAADGRVWLAYGQVDNVLPPPSDHGGGHKHGAARTRPAGDIFVARSDDGGASFAAPRKVATLPSLMLGMRRGPRIAAHGDRVTVTVIAHELFAFTSADGGANWTDPIVINEVPTSAREGLHDLAVSGAGQLFVTWLDLRNGKMELWGANSADGGRTWSKNEQVYRSPDKSICECCHPTAQFDDDGNLAVMWRNSIEGARDMWMTTRLSGTRTFGPPKKLGTGSWKLNACPMDGGRIIALGGGKFSSVWQRAGEVFLAPPDGPEVLLGKGKQPIGVRRGGETFVWWQEGTDLVSARADGTGAPTKQASDARFAVGVALPGKRGTVIAYEQGPAKEKQPGLVVERL